jgi:ferric-dicitrate binding protein FerR (iron transport regulator)
VVLALGATGAWYSIPVTHTAAAGEQSEIALPDGSTVALNAGSEISYRRGFSWLPGLPAGTRTVKLEGEAFFTATPSPRAFRVQAQGVEVRVLGTRFNVRARSTEAPRVDVEEGRVQVSSPGTERSVILRAGEAATADPSSGELTASDVDLQRVGAWRSGGLVLEDAPLSAVLSELSLRFDAPVTLAEGVSTRARLNLYYADLTSLESVVSDLATQQGLRYRATRSGWELF